MAEGGPLEPPGQFGCGSADRVRLDALPGEQVRLGDTGGGVGRVGQTEVNAAPVVGDTDDPALDHGHPPPLEVCRGRRAYVGGLGEVDDDGAGAHVLRGQTG